MSALRAFAARRTRGARGVVAARRRRASPSPCRARRSFSGSRLDDGAAVEAATGGPSRGDGGGAAMVALGEVRAAPGAVFDDDAATATGRRRAAEDDASFRPLETRSFENGRRTALADFLVAAEKRRSSHGPQQRGLGRLVRVARCLWPGARRASS